MDFNQGGTNMNLFAVDRTKAVQSSNDYNSSNQLTAQSTVKTQKNTSHTGLDTRLNSAASSPTIERHSHSMASTTGTELKLEGDVCSSLATGRGHHLHFLEDFRLLVAIDISYCE
ncbi:hypothetical protein AVEN_272841-1 [Araneus ventricosus]|uniref:Uncharacterized protein n=1 Tax=Araneus ventricosus TaxID=182803 RepID=A0A4Y2JRP4_ARAVE|nr:hypothetical protein AVEN_272841-1 [Araneus ventricosus]